MFVYKITNTANDRVYVGLTTGSIKKRWREHKCAANTGSEKPLYRAMRKHGIDNFSICVIYTASSIEDMRNAEIRFIQELKAHALENGYNLTDHGYRHGNINQPAGERSYNAKLTEQVVAFIRDPIHWDKPNSQLLDMVKEQFGIDVSRDGLRDARRGDVWKHLNDKYPPVKSERGSRKQPISEENKQKAKAILDLHRPQALKKLAESKKGKRGPNAKLPEATIKEIFYSPLSLLKTAEQFGVSKKMVLLVKQRKTHIYLTKDL